MTEGSNTGGAKTASGQNGNKPELDLVATGEVLVVGHLVLNYNKVRFSAKVDLATLKGQGKLVYMGEHEPGEEVDIRALEAM